MACRTLIIHLDRATARKPQVGRLEDLLGGEAVSAIDGEALGDGDRAAYEAGGLHSPRYPFALRNGEIAAFLSHRECWRVIADGPDKAVLLLEDDVEIEPEVFSRALSLCLGAIGPDDFVRFPASRPDGIGVTLARDGPMRLHKPWFGGRGAYAQLVGKAAAARLLERSLRFDRPVDEYLLSPWMSGVRPLSVWPSGVAEVSHQLSGSLIGRRKTGPDRLRRELGRPIYRARRFARAVAEWFA